MQETLLESSLKVERATEGLTRQAVRRLSEHVHKLNSLSIANFLLACRVESNISSTYREDLIFTLCKLSNYIGKNFKDFTREDILAFDNQSQKQNN
jgi:hypothetical protein